jgi:DNA-binding PadR family transcriptional regulator
LKLECILLGLIHLRPSVSGYEIKTIINKSTGYFFSASLSQIYPALKNLTNDGLITFEVEPLVGKQDRKVYTITPAGYQALVEWLSEPLELDASLNAFEDFLLKFTFIGILEREKIAAYLNAGLEHFKTEKKRVLENDLANEKAFLKIDPVSGQRFVELWSRENQFLIEDLDRKIGWIETMLEDLRKEEG